MKKLLLILVGLFIAISTSFGQISFGQTSNEPIYTSSNYYHNNLIEQINRNIRFFEVTQVDIYYADNSKISLYQKEDMSELFTFLYNVDLELSRYRLTGMRPYKIYLYGYGTIYLNNQFKINRFGQYYGFNFYDRLFLDINNFNYYRYNHYRYNNYRRVDNNIRITNNNQSHRVKDVQSKPIISDDHRYRKPSDNVYRYERPKTINHNESRHFIINGYPNNDIRSNGVRNNGVMNRTNDNRSNNGVMNRTNNGGTNNGGTINKSNNSQRTVNPPQRTNNSTSTTNRSHGGVGSVPETISPDDWIKLMN